MIKNSMNDDINAFGVYNINGKFLKEIKNTSCYNHQIVQLHHFIKKQHYSKNPQWFLERKIKQKLILLPISLHYDLHSGMSDLRFKELYNIGRWDLLFSRKNYIKEN